MKSIEATLIALFVGLALITESHAENCYFYEGPTGEVVISNKERPPGSKIIKRLPDLTDREIPQAHRADRCPIDALCV
ncbi:MAG TPA: hypothetical protein VEG60_33835 [Candidatus Binatia bacterium]|nr:hypothetical protein [Candidatus Binatia bacterium]